jgi:hypothetical protein
MLYIFDTNAFIVLAHYFPSRFPNFWKELDRYVAEGRIQSVREVRHELDSYATKPHLEDWIEANKPIFKTPGADESIFVGKIFELPVFQGLIKKRNSLVSRPAADPFVIASAKINHGTVVTEEKLKPNGAKIPNVCKHFGIPCTNLEGFMETEGWVF